MQINMCKVKYGKILAMMYFLGTKKRYYLDPKIPQRFLILSYGLPGRPLDEKSQTVEKLVKNNFVVVCPNYIGTFSSYGKFKVEGTVKTILETIKFIKGRRSTELWNLEKFSWKVKDITLIGGSFGGAISLVAGAKSRSIKAIIAISSPIDWKIHANQKGREDLTNLYNIVSRGWSNIWRVYDKGNWKRFANGKLDINPIDYIKQLKNKDVLLIHGKKDQVVPVEMSKILFKKINKGKGKHKLLILKNEKHCSNYILAKRKVFKEILSFLKHKPK